MRILHTSDWHLGQYFYGKSRAQEHQQFLHWLLAQVKEHNIDAIIVAGDIFDTSTPPSYAREMYFNFIGNMQVLNCQLIVLAGNHDSVAMLSESQQLLHCLNAKVIASVNGDNDLSEIAQQVFVLENAQGQAQAVMCAVPFIRPRDVIKSQAGQSAQQKQRSLQQAITEHYQHLYQYAQTLAEQAAEQATADQEENTHKRLPIIATGHLTAMGVTTSDSVRDIYIGTLEAFPASAFPPADYIALGHIHRAQKVGKTEHIRYCGSPIALSFDEAKQNKRVLMVDVVPVAANESALSLVTELIIPCFQPLAMVKTQLENLTEQVATLVEDLQPEQILWLDIEIDSSEYLQDLQPRINKLIAQFPVEVLLVRRSKKSRKLLQAKQEKITLNELSLDDVFNSRLALEDWQNEEQTSVERVDSEKAISEKVNSQKDLKPNETRKQQLQQLFKQTVEQVLAQMPESSFSLKTEPTTVLTAKESKERK